jgi:hypothetical protein
MQTVQKKRSVYLRGQSPSYVFSPVAEGVEHAAGQ